MSILTPLAFIQVNHIQQTLKYSKSKYQVRTGKHLTALVLIYIIKNSNYEILNLSTRTKLSISNTFSVQTQN